MRTELVGSTRLAITPPADWRQAVDAWLDNIGAGTDAVSRDTLDGYRRFTGRFFSWLPAGSAVDGRTVRRWLDHVTVQNGRGDADAAASTVNLHLVALRSFCRWAVREGHLDQNPTDGVRGRKRRGVGRIHRRDELTPDEVRAVLAACAEEDSLVGSRDGALIALMAYTAVRTVEVHRADTENLQTVKGRRVLWVHGKGASEPDEFVVLPAQVEPYVRRWLAARPRGQGPLFVSLSPRSRGERLTRRGIRDAVKNRYAQAGITEATKTTHSLRHSAIGSAIRNGATPQQAQAMARHANVSTTMIYFHEADRLTSPAEDLIDYGGAEP